MISYNKGIWSPGSSEFIILDGMMLGILAGIIKEVGGEIGKQIFE